MTTRSQRGAPTRGRSTARRRPPARSITINLGQPARRSQSGHGLLWQLWRFTRWVGRWMGRATAWTGRQAVRRTAGHVVRTRATWRAWSDLRGEHGLRTWIAHDRFTGAAQPARSVRVDTPSGGNPDIRDQQDADAVTVADHLNRRRIEHMITRRVRPPRWERLLAALRLHTIDWAPYEESLRARFAVMRQYRERLEREAVLFGATPRPAPAGWGSFGRYPGGTDGWGQPAPHGGGAPNLVPTSPTHDYTARPFRAHRTQGDGSMANPIREWNDLADPDIDPVNFPDELPDHFGQVRDLFARENYYVDSAASTAAKGAGLFGGYVEYLNTAGVVPSVVSAMADAHEEINAVVTAMRQAAEAMARAAALAEQARRAAEAAYGDWEVPDFRRANAG